MRALLCPAGISAEMMAGVTHSLRDVQADLLKMISQETIMARAVPPPAAAPAELASQAYGTRALPQTRLGSDQMLTKAPFFTTDWTLAGK